MKFRDRVAHAWNVFTNKDPTENEGVYKSSSTSRPDKRPMRFVSEKTIIGALYNRISIDVSNNYIYHIRRDEEDNFESRIFSTLDDTFNTSPNLDQTRRSFMQDIVLSMIDEGCVAIVPTTTNYDPFRDDSYEITSLRVASIIEWAPDRIRVNVYNETTGQKQNIWVPKKFVAIIENPHYLVMNDYNSTLKRLIRKLSILDAIDEQSGSGKLDILIQLPYVIKTEARKAIAQERIKDIEVQLTQSKHGVAYVDGSEKITQLNRPAENNLMAQIEFLTSMLYSQLGITPTVFDGTAEEAVMLNYLNTTVEPILDAIVLEFRKKFLTKTARTQRQDIIYFHDPFKLVPVSQIADIADKMSRNEILSSNELRAIIGRRPSKQTGADELRNKNLNQPDPQVEVKKKEEQPIVEKKV